MSLSSLARSPESENLIKFAIAHRITEDWESPELLCHVNGRVLSGTVSVGESDKELVVHISPVLGNKCSIHLSTLLALSTAYIKYQYEAVAMALAESGKSSGLAWDGKPFCKDSDSRVMIYASIVARHGHNSEEANIYHSRCMYDNDFVSGAAMVRMKARILKIISEEEEAKIQQLKVNAGLQKIVEG